MNKKSIVVAAGVVLGVAGAALLPIKGDTGAMGSQSGAGIDLSGFSAAKPETPLHLLFLHHSVGGQLFADAGPKAELADCIYTSHPYGGGLRARLNGEGYDVHEASYGSEVADKTDIFDWLPKFRGKIDKILTCSHNDEFYRDGTRNQVVLFKSCFPNSEFEAKGDPPGQALGPTLTVWNAKASFAAVLEELKKQPQTLFVYLTAPPVASHHPERAWKWVLKKALGRRTAAETAFEQAALAREFNNWVKSPSGWLKDYPLKNVVVFDYYDVLTGDESNFLKYPTEGGTDSHPDRPGQQKAASAFVPFLNQAVRRAGLSK